VLLVGFMAVVLHYRQQANPAQQVAFKATRVDLVGHLQLSLSSASEAEKSAVLATTDQDSRTLADKARAATAVAEQDREALGKLLANGGTESERALLAQFTEAFASLRRIDDEVLGLAVQNTNLKAYALAFGPAADTLAEMDAALARVMAKRADSPDSKRVIVLVSSARIGVLRIQALLAPHIAEESDSKMESLETAMAGEEKQVGKDLEALAAAPALKGDAALAAAATSFTRYVEFKRQILKLSHENTNVRSLALSLNQKRKAMTLCLDNLDALQQAILAEPIPGVTYGRPQNPR
jgi:hypothetical protein